MHGYRVKYVPPSKKFVCWHHCHWYGSVGRWGLWKELVVFEISWWDECPLKRKRPEHILCVCLSVSLSLSLYTHTHAQAWWRKPVWRHRDKAGICNPRKESSSRTYLASSRTVVNLCHAYHSRPFVLLKAQKVHHHWSKTSVFRTVRK